MTTRKRGIAWWSGAVLTLVIVLAAATWGAGAAAGANLRAQNPALGQLIDVGGYQMHIHCVGEGSPTVVLAAGLDEFSIFWSQVQPEAAKFARVCAYDRAGLGWSEPSSYPRTGETQVKELHTLLVNANIEGPYVLVGHSFGGALARLYAHNFPDEVAGLVLVDAAPDDLFVRIPFWQNLFEQKLGLFRTLSALNSFGLLALAPQSIPNRGLPDEALAQYRAIAASTGYFQTGVAENEAFESTLVEVRAARVALGDMPLIVMSRGYWDPIPGLSEAQNQFAWQTWQEMQSELLALSSNSRQIIAGQSEHNIHLQQPELVTAAIQEMVEAARK